MKIFSFTILVCLLVMDATAQSQESQTFTLHALLKPEDTFPKSFIGNWKGQLKWMVAAKPTQTFTMQLKIQPTVTANQYTWQLIYGDDNKDNRSYILNPIDACKAHRVVPTSDEYDWA